jgi:hypothetical protein
MTMPETKPWADTGEMLPRMDRAAARVNALVEDILLSFEVSCRCGTDMVRSGLEGLVKNDQLQSMKTFERNV